MRLLIAFAAVTIIHYAVSYNRVLSLLRDGAARTRIARSGGRPFAAVKRRMGNRYQTLPQAVFVRLVMSPLRQPAHLTC
jgi:hypothetical protein